MKYCKNCKVNVKGKRNACPLCQGILTGSEEIEEEIFPKIPFVYREHKVLLKFMMFFSIVVASVSVGINILLINTGAWSLIVLGGLASAWVSIITAINKRHNIPKNIIYQVMVISVIVIIWDFLTHWKGWSIEYVIPFVCVFAMSSMAVISKILKLHLEDYILYLIIDGLFGIIPIIFIIFGFIKVIYPSIICILTSIISLSAILIFEGESMKEEMKKRLHI